MAILKVARLGHPVLRRVTAPLSPQQLESSEIQKFIDDMVETMKEYDGVGLAADQVHESKQIAVLEVADNPRYPEKPKVPLIVLVNPEIIPLTEETEDDWEGCLSDELDFVAHGFHARVIQHEWDHLNGKVYLDRMRDLSTLAFLTEFARYWLRS